MIKHIVTVVFSCSNFLPVINVKVSTQCSFVHMIACILIRDLYICNTLDYSRVCNIWPLLKDAFNVITLQCSVRTSLQRPSPLFSHLGTWCVLHSSTSVHIYCSNIIHCSFSYCLLSYCIFCMCLYFFRDNLLFL